ncbi:MAG: class I SAM-dependent methyltransferase [Rhodospirillaceae bacterium]|nr:class I SAM-dependent methyltransferase [Rhodospirillaceae bacterium]
MSDAKAAAAFASAEQAYLRGDLKTALNGYLTALMKAPGTALYRRTALEVLAMFDGYGKLAAPIVAALEDCARDPTLDMQPLMRVVKNIVLGDARFAALDASLANGRFDADLANGDFDWFFTNPLLLAVLVRATSVDEASEAVYTRLRRAVLEHPELAARHGAFVEALACYCVRTRHVWAETPEERAKLAGKSALIRCLYDPIGADADNLPPLLKQISAERAEERALAAALPQLTPIAPGLSAAMQAQYENYPYPPWVQNGAVEPTRWPAFTARYMPQPPFPIPNPEVLDILVAGCGTGRSSVDLAQRFPTARITAVDLSRASLGYAARMAKAMNVPNISFGVADILMLGELGRTFTFIECGGVLHHMNDPAAGLAMLTGLLTPGGVMRLSLYSERARAPIVAARAFVAEHKFPDTLEGLRAARAAILALPEDHPVRRVARRTDFASADGLHDLIVNVHEERYTPDGLKALFDNEGLTFLGFDIANPAKRAAYQAQYPHDPLGRDLDAWEEFEKVQADTFQAMFQMWLQKPAP